MTTLRTLLIPLALALASIGHGACGPRAQIAAPADVDNPPDTAHVTDTGLVYSVLKEGHGVTPRFDDKVTVHYTGWTVDGAMFDSSVSKGKPARFTVDGVIAGWTEILQLMKTGSTYRIWVPEHLAYQGEAGFPSGTLVFDLALISVD